MAGICSAALDGYDIVVVALPNHPKTRSLINSEILQLMDAATLINVGRAQVVVIKDLLYAIDAGHVSRAVLDVFETEPLAVDSSLWSHPKIWLTPHVAGLTQPADAVSAFVSALQRLEKGLKPELTVSPRRGY